MVMLSTCRRYGPGLPTAQLGTNVAQAGYVKGGLKWTCTSNCSRLLSSLELLDYPNIVPLRSETKADVRSRKASENQTRWFSDYSDWGPGCSTNRGIMACHRHSGSHRRAEGILWYSRDLDVAYCFPRDSAYESHARRQRIVRAIICCPPSQTEKNNVIIYKKLTIIIQLKDF